MSEIRSSQNNAIGISSHRESAKLEGQLGDRSVKLDRSDAPRTRSGGNVLSNIRNFFARAFSRGTPPEPRISAPTGGHKMADQLTNTAKSQITGHILDLNRFINGVEKLKDTQAYAPMQQALQDIGLGIEQVSESPAGVESIAEHIGELAKSEFALETRISDLESLALVGEADTLRNELVNTLKDQLNTLGERKAYLSEMVVSNPTSKQAINHAKAQFTESAIRLLEEKLQEVPVGTDGYKALQQAKQTLVARQQELLKEKSLDTPPDLKAAMGEKKANKETVQEITGKLSRGEALPLHHPGIREEGIMTLVLKHAFEQAGLGEDAVKHLKHDIKDAHTQVLNDQQWTGISKTVQFSHAGTSVSYTSSIDPAATLGGVFDSYGGKGVCCHDSTETSHAVNLARTELTDDKGDVLFEGFRHGVNSAYGLTDKALKALDKSALKEMVKELVPDDTRWVKSADTPDLDATVDKILTDKSFRKEMATTMRTQASINRGREILQAIISSNPEKLQQARQTGKVDVTLSSISLLTPDLIRGIIGGADERKMLQEQLTGWQALQPAQTLTLKDANGDDINVKVDVDVMAFNFGVNQGGVVGMGPISSSSALGSWGMGWNEADQANSLAMDKLIGPEDERTTEDGQRQFGGQVGEFLKTANAEDARVVRQLASQIQDIWDSGSYKVAGNEPYKMVSRLAVLTHMLGDSAVFNCKSGKDRTGELDVEAKFLATQIQLTGSVPEPDHIRTPQEKQQFFQMAVNSGNHEMQRMNVGGAGFKLEGVDALTEQLGGESEKLVHRGLSKFFGS